MKFADVVSFVESAEADRGTLYLIGPLIVPVRAGESLADAYRREIENAPKRHGIIRDMKISP